jgi:hypothetical protein
MARNLLQISGLNCARCFTSPTSKQPHTTLSQTVQSTVERLHRRLKDALRARPAAATWSEELPFVLLGLQAQPREDPGLSPAEAVFSTPCSLMNFCKMKKCQLMLL